MTEIVIAESLNEMENIFSGFVSCRFPCPTCLTDLRMMNRIYSFVDFVHTVDLSTQEFVVMDLSKAL